jgi:hypothetical protein
MMDMEVAVVATEAIVAMEIAIVGTAVGAMKVERVEASEELLLGDIECKAK